MNPNQTEQRKYLIQELINENPELKKQAIQIPSDEQQQRLLLRALFNIREPRPISAKFKQVQDEYLQAINQEKGIVKADHFPDGISLWQGDITRLQVGAIVNAANSGMTGCYIPNHGCIDNAIHTFAGIELRNRCNELMQAQGHPEAVGTAKITPAYNLPAQYVIHTVGPAITGEVTPQDQAALASSYRSCLELAAKNQLTSIAFPCISTGVFHFPNQLAAEIAVQTTREFLANHPTIKKVIFDVFKPTDKAIYEQLLATDK